MSNKTEHTPNAEQFEDLLKDAFLDLDLDDPKNEAIIEALSATVMTPAAIHQTKPAGSFKKFFGKISLQSVLLTGLAILCLIIGFQWHARSTASGKKNNTMEKPVPAAGQSSARCVAAVKEYEKTTTEESQSGLDVQPNLPTPLHHAAIFAGSVQMADTSTTVQAERNTPGLTEPVMLSSSDTLKVKGEIPFGFPQFTEEDVEANLKQKKKMMDQLVKRSKPNYLLIPNGKLAFNGDIKLIGNFYMQGHEVTNLEYRTFLFDLVFEKKKDEYLRARPNNAQWLYCNGTDKFNGFKNEYFSNKAYDDYPVVNITAEAARMYCVWLDKILEEREDGTFEFYIDLPRESEWIYCAKGGFTSGSYPWGTDFIQNNYNNFLANFNVQQLQENFNQPYSYRTHISKNAYTSAGLATNTDTMATTQVFDYNPNAYGLYCMSGNVAEWVVSEDGETAKALGGSWGSDFEHLKIGRESEYKGKISSPFIGFRVLVLVKKNQ